MEQIPNSESFYLSGGRTGVLLLHGLTGSPASILPWAQGIHEAGFTVSVPRIAGHGTKWEDLNRSTWQDWYDSVQTAFLTLKENCDRVFVGGFSVGGALALKLAQIRGSEIEGLLLLNPSIFDDRKFFRALPILKHFVSSIKGGASDVAKPGAPIHGYDRIPLRALDSLREMWKQVENDLYLVENPLLIGYSINDHVVDPICSQTIIDNVFSPSIREIIFERSFHNVSLDYEVEDLIAESIEYINDVLSGEFEQSNESDEKELINAEFDSIVSQLSLDESAPTTYLDELDRRGEEHFIRPDPKLPPVDQAARIAIICLIAGPAYLVLEYFTGFSFFGTGPWAGVLVFIGGVVASIVRLARSDDEDEWDDGAEV
ncbi:MAG TPA: alpha/beta fold hydrolase [Candidatus Nanopelagicaceae bacterium]